MRAVWGTDERLARPTCLALGVFDGVHIGHRRVIGMAVANARMGVSPAVLTFDPHPDAVVNPRGAPPLLTTTGEKIEILRRLGVKLVVVARFDQALAGMPAEDFVANVLVNRLRARCIVVGENWRFGAGERGTTELLEQMSSSGAGFVVATVSPVILKGEPVSSTRIRRLLLDGEIGEANELLGQLYSLSGHVVKGYGLGRKLGFPTANLEVPAEKLIPADGVYASWVRSRRLESGLKWPAMCYIGRRPTFGGSGVRRVEVHLLRRRGPVGSLGNTLRVEFVSHLRPDRRFPSADGLVEQMAIDRLNALDVLTLHET